MMRTSAGSVDTVLLLAVRCDGLAQQPDLLEDPGEELALVIRDWKKRPADVGVLEDAQDPEAFLEPDPVVTDRPCEHDVGQPLDALPERPGVIDPAVVPGVDHVDLLAGHHGAKADQR